MKIDGFKKNIEQNLAAVFESMNIPVSFSTDIMTPPESVDAEYAFPCFQVAKHLNIKPNIAAAEIIAKMSGRIESCVISAAGPYINFKWDTDLLFRSVVAQILQQKDTFGFTPSDVKSPIIVEYSSPNTNKPLHLGHIRNNVLGMAVINLLKSQGYRVIPASILNDRGIHICKAMLAYQLFGQMDSPESTAMKGDHFVGQYYVRFEKEAAQNPQLLESAHEMLRSWEAGDEETRDLWKKMNRWVIEGFNETYHRMGSVFELIQKESDTYETGRQIAFDGLKQSIFYQKEDGSIWIDLTDIGLDHKTIIRADGTTLYLTQDLGVAVDRFKHFDPFKVIYVVGSEQNYHFQVLFEVLKRLGYDWKEKCHHLSYGMVYLPDGKMKSREGRVVDADELMDDMKAYALQIIKESHLSIEQSEQESVAEAIGLGAIKYFILKVNPQKDIHFDPAASLSFDGMTAAYIQYAYARIQSILRKASSKSAGESLSYGILGRRDELLLIRKMFRFPEILRSAANDMNPSWLAMYLWELAKVFSVFYTNHRILDAESIDLQSARLRLCEAVAQTLKTGLNLLGIKVVDRM